MSDVVIRSIRFFLGDDLFLALSCSNAGIKKLLQWFPVERDRDVGGKGRLCVLYDTLDGRTDRGPC